MINEPLVSVVIATFNSAGTLKRVLESIHGQDLSKTQVEILIIDGGSTDNTLALAKEFNCIVIKNPKVEPISAKILGFQNARGRYLLYIDADEVIESPKSFSQKLSVFVENPDVKAVIGSGYVNPKNSTFSTRYINEFGDPFSFFMYPISKNVNYFINELKKKFQILKEDNKSIIFDFRESNRFLLFELGAANTMIDLDYMKHEFRDFDIEVFSHLFQFLNKKEARVAITKQDPIIHYSTVDFKDYLKKIHWRVKNNIHHRYGIGVSGFSGREKFHPKTYRIKKYLFVPYAFTLLIPFLDSLHFVVTRKEISYLLHMPLTIYTAFLLLYHYLLKAVGIKPVLRNYDESIEIE